MGTFVTFLMALGILTLLYIPEIEEWIKKKLDK